MSYAPKHVIAGLVPAIHKHRISQCSWMAGTSAGHDGLGMDAENETAALERERPFSFVLRFDRRCTRDPRQPHGYSMGHRSYPDIFDVVALKVAGSRQRTTLSFAEKLELLDAWREAVEAIVKAQENRQHVGRDAEH